LNKGRPAIIWNHFMDNEFTREVDYDGYDGTKKLIVKFAFKET
jgi:hypothetical protein